MYKHISLRNKLLYFTLNKIVSSINLLLFFSRGYSTKKLKSNVECEIFQTIYEEAMESYNHSIVHELRSETFADMERNISQISAWVNQWIKDNVSK